MLRVIAGTARSLKLKYPEGTDTRPTTDRIKETLFNMLSPYLGDALFVDLFSGSGAIGIEALSRGARKCYFIESNQQAIQCIKENIEFTKFTEQSLVLKQDCITGLHHIMEKQVDLVFLDPPYDRDYEKKVLQVFQNLSYITEETLIVVEASLSTKFEYLQELGFEITKEKKYKTNKHVFIRRSQY